MRLGIIKITFNRTAQPRCYRNVFYGRQFREPRRGDNSDFAVTIWASESASVCFVISLSICYWLFKCGVLRTVCVRERERESQRSVLCVCLFLCVCVCVCKREGHRASSCVCARVCKYSSLQTVRAEDTVTQPRVVCKHIWASSMCLSRNSVLLSSLNWC